MNKIWVTVGGISLFVLLLGAWFFIGNLGGFSQFLGEKSKEAYSDEQLKFVGTWTAPGSVSLTLFSTGSYRKGVVEGTWALENGLLVLSEEGETPSQVTYEYVFSENDTLLQLTEVGQEESLLLTKQSL
jgi:hypothetical protein